MGVTQFNGNTGYRGVVKIQKLSSTRTAARPAAGDMVAMLATSGPFNISHQPIYTTGVWGAGYMNAAEKVAYANDIARLDGSVGIEYTAGDVFEAIRGMCFEYRGNKYGTFIQILPNGKNGFEGKAWATSLSFSASQGTIVTGDFNWTSYLDESNGTNQILTEQPSDSAFINSKYGALSAAADGSTQPADANIPFVYNGVYPYWGTDIQTASVGGNDWALVPDVISWSANYDSSIEQLKCCGMQTGTYVDNVTGSKAPLAPDYLGIGQMNSACQMEIFRLKGDFSDDSFHQRQSLRFIMHTPQDGGYTPGSPLSGAHTYIVTFPIAVKNQGSSNITTGASWITASYSFDGVGDFKNPPLNLTKYSA